jgi:phosphate transport system permease protein
MKTLSTQSLSYPQEDFFQGEEPRFRLRKMFALFFQGLCTLAALISVLILVLLLTQIFRLGWPGLSLDFLLQGPSRFPYKTGIYPALGGTLCLFFLTAFFSIPVGVGAAIYLEELMPSSFLKKIIEIQMANLTCVPSIIFGILGSTVFVKTLHLGGSLLSGALTLTLLSFPSIMTTSMEALRSAPKALREGALALGATPWQTAKAHILPWAAPQIGTGLILSLSRAIGETAPLVMVGGMVYIGFSPKSLLDDFTALPLQIYHWACRPEESFHSLAATGILVLLLTILGANGVAIYLRNHFQRKNLWQKL